MAVDNPQHEPAIVTRLRDCMQALDELPDALAELSSGELEDVVSGLLRLRSRSEQLATLGARLASERGDVTASDAANTTQWIGNCAERASVPLPVHDAHTLATVADACLRGSAPVITDGLRAGTCTPEAAKTALREAAKVAPILPDVPRDEILGWYLGVDPALGQRGLQVFTRRLLADHDAERLDDEDAALERTESLRWFTTETGLTRLVAELAPVNAAMTKEAIVALSAPRPTSAGHAGAPQRGAERIRDDRTAAKRRADAFVALISAGARITDATSEKVGAAARVTVTIPLATLTKGIGSATTALGDVLDPGAARRLACDAEIIPVVLGSQSEPLDVGRSDRVASRGLRVAVSERDHGCTFPGCDRPPQFCEVHHVVPWAAGGDTSLLNSAMLCTTHHQIVHRLRYTAVVSAAAVVWDPTPGRMASGSGTDAA